MRKLLTILFFFICKVSFATIYYISPSGNNSTGTSPANAWTSILVLNTKWNTVPINAGDQILFERGQSFYGNIIITRSGTSGNPITIGSFGSGALPIIHTYTTLTGWTNDGGGIWHRNVPNAKNSLINVSLDNQLQQIGRFPNTNAAQGGYLTYTAISSAPSLTGPALSSATNWDNAEVVIRKLHWIVDRCRITDHTGGVVTYTNSTAYPGKPGYGYFFQDDIRTLDQFGEWFLNKSTKDLSMYFGANNPSSYTIKAATFDTVINCGSQSYITITNVAIEGGNGFAVAARNGSNITVTNCTLNNNYDAISIKGTTTTTITGNTITNTLNNAVAVTWANSGGTHTISNNILRRIALKPGMGGSGDGNYGGIEQTGDNVMIEYNVLDSLGYCGIISGQHNNITIQYNLVTYHCFVKDDGAGIYTARGLDAYHVNEVNRVIRFNIVGNGVGATNGTPNFANPGVTYDAHGVYADASAKNLYVYNNSTFNHANGTGMFINGDTAITTRNHTSYLDHYGLKIERLGSATLQQSRNRFMIYANNISFPTTTNIKFFNQQINLPVVVTPQQDIRNIFTRIDSNFYRNTVSAPFHWITDNPSQGASMNFAAWQTYVNSESNSQVITTATPVRFDYNATNAPKSFMLGAIYTDVRGNVYNGAITLQPFTSSLLFYSAPLGGNEVPVANAGPDKAITLPTNFVTVIGSGTDPDGTISAYFWQKISGPGTFTIASPNASTTAINNLIAGVYQFTLTVTDNQGATDKDTVQVTVVANQAPTANAGSNQTLTLPTNSTSLIGSGSDPDGTISSYSWTLISGPNSPTFGTANAQNTSISNLIEGVYQIQLTVTDNGNSTGSDIVQVTVLAEPNTPPSVNAGTDQVVTLPTNIATLTGSGSDAEGPVTFQWVQVFGPNTATINSPTSNVTTVSGLIQGFYTFVLEVTDNDGEMRGDGVQVTVNAANLPPVANAGIDQVITLPTNSTTLTGSGTDPDGSISSYSWVKLSGTGGTIGTPNAASTTVSSLVEDVYQYELTVTDNQGATDKDTVQVTVNPVPNVAPSADAGVDQAITLPTNSVTLSGGGTDSDGTITSYAWLKISGPASGTIVSPSSASTSVNSLVQGVYKFELTVTDNDGAIDKDTMQVIVNAAANQTPIADAGTNQVITLPTNNTTLLGSGIDNDGTIESYGWVQLSGPSAASINSPSSGTTNISGLIQGTYQFELTVHDDDDDSAKDQVQVIVNAANVAPVASAGTDKVITLPTNSVVLIGNGTDSDGTISTYGWIKISGPATFTIVSPASSTTTVNNLVEGVYEIELTVTDNQGATGKDTVQITVNPVVNSSPSADAGADQTITLPINIATLVGSGTDSDGTITNYEWTQISGPFSVIVSPNSATTDVIDSLPGQYFYQLKVTDNDDDTAVDIMIVTVEPQPENILPVANAGPNQIITLPVNQATLSGSGTDADGNIVSYQWRQITTESATITNTNAAVTTVTGLGPVQYIFELTVTDDRGGVSTDTMIITVNEQPVSVGIAMPVYKFIPN